MMETCMLLAAEIQCLEIVAENGKLAQVYKYAGEDLRSITRAQIVEVSSESSADAISILETDKIKFAILD
jgi:hypothetical protein